MFRENAISGECAASGQEALEFLQLYDYDLVLTDLRLPASQELLRMMRSTPVRVPALVLSFSATSAEKVELLDHGADDVLDIPCDSSELLARIRAVVRRNRGHTHSALKLGPVELRLDRREVTAYGVPFNLSRREYAALELLLLRQGTLLTKDAFLTHLYCGSDEPGTKAIDVVICRLRKKLALAGVYSLVDTVWGGGYILRDLSAPPAKLARDNCPESASGLMAA
jgi:two-component system cell cycle response regulator CtrA